MNCCIIFDLDGTLIDSREDIAEAVNATRAAFGMEQLPLETILGYTGDGVRKLMERTFCNTGVNIDDAIRTMNRYYTEHATVKTRTYPGVMDGLKNLSEHGWFIGVISNKPTELCEIILRELGIGKYCNAVLGGNSGFPLKPAPDSVLHLLEKANADKDNSWFCGDNHTDMNAAGNAGIHSAFVTYGFGELGTASYDIKADSFAELIEHLNQKYISSCL